MMQECDNASDTNISIIDQNKYGRHDGNNHVFIFWSPTKKEIVPRYKLGGSIIIYKSTLEEISHFRPNQQGATSFAQRMELPKINDDDDGSGVIRIKYSILDSIPRAVKLAGWLLSEHSHNFGL
jgi:hypothetical protein